MIARHLNQLFSGMQVVQHHTFRVTRNEDVEVEEDDAENLLLALEKELLRRRVGRPPVRLEVEDDIDPKMLELLISELDITEREVFHLPGPLDLRGLFSLADIDRAELKYPAFLPSTHPHLAEVETASPADMFAALKHRDVLLHHPYDSFATSVQRFIEQAAEDPQVLAIKQTLYRTSGDSPIIDALVEAAEAGKQVLALVEIKARFDEQANIAWARRLERHGCHVVYGLLGSEDPLQAVHGGPRRAGGAAPLRPHRHRQLQPQDRPDVRGHGPAHRQPDHHRGRRPAVQPPVRDEPGDPVPAAAGRPARHPHRPAGPDQQRDRQRTRTASRPAFGSRSTHWSTRRSPTRSTAPRRPGCKVDLWVRGICTMRPGAPGLSENIRVRSILGRFLEHSRLFWFANGGSPTVGIGSADLMHRNLDRRVEVLASITNPAHVAEISDLFDIAFDKGTASWKLQPDGTWIAFTTDERGATAARHAGVPDQRHESAPGGCRSSAHRVAAITRRQHRTVRCPPRPSRSWPAVPS